MSMHAVLGNIWFLAKRKVYFHITEPKSGSYYLNLNTHRNQVTLWGIGGWGIGPGRLHFRALVVCAVYILTIYDELTGLSYGLWAPCGSAGLLHGKEKDGKQVDMGIVFSTIAFVFCCFVYAPIKPRLQEYFLSVAIRQPQLPWHLLYEPQSF